MSFVGYVQIEDTLYSAVLFRDAARTPVDTDAAPTFRVYGPDGLVPAATSAAAHLDAGTVTEASNAAPIVITSANHGLTTGTYITVSGVLGNTGANGSFTVTRIDADTFSLDGSTGTGSWTSGGAWNVTGLYRYTVVCTAANGFEAGTTYHVLLQGDVAGVPAAEVQVFIVT
jgi:hypothetical protein